MVKFIDIDPADINTDRSGRRGRISYPILKGFMERNTKLSKLDLTGLNKNPNYLRSVLYSYIRSHNLPIRLFSAGGDLHLMRLDLNNDGTPNPDWQKDPSLQATEGSAGAEANLEALPLSPEVVQNRFEQEKGQTLK